MSSGDAVLEFPDFHDEVGLVTALCRRTIATDFADLVRHLPALPRTAESWFRLLEGIPHKRASIDALSRLTVEAKRLGVGTRGAIERLGILEACRVALPQLATLPVHESVNRQFCDTIRRVATTSQGWGNRLDHDSDAFAELARIVTLRRFHAGQQSFDIMATPRAWFLKIHPLALPGVVRHVVAEMGGLGPIIMPHLNYWRSNPMMMLLEEHELAMWRIVRSLERQPRIKGLVAASWLYSVEVVAVSPHLAWLRDFYLQNGAYLVDMDPAPERAGFLVGSTMRRRLYAEGKFRPRQTLILWPRDAMLAWAEGGAARPKRAAPSTERRPEPNWKSNANRTLSSGHLTLINCERLLTEQPRPYIFLVFVLPCLLVAIAVAATLGLWAVVPAVVVSAVLTWLLQYFFLQ